MEDMSNYEKLYADAQTFYRRLQPILFSPLNEYVHFTSKGFNHIEFKNQRNRRDNSSQVLRFKLLPTAVKLIDITTTYQEYEETIKEFRIQTRKKRIHVTKTVRYWGIIAIIDNRKIKVIVRKVGDGQLHFWSLMPSWITSKRRDSKFFDTFTNPEEA